MKKFIVVTESGTDLPLDLAKLYNIHVLAMHVVMDDVDYQDGSIPVTNVYDYHKRTKKIPTTSAVNPNEYQYSFQKITEENPGCTIIHIGYSSKASCTYQNSLIGSEGMKNVYHVDSLNVTGGEAAIVIKAVQLTEECPDIEPKDLVEKIRNFVYRAKVSFIPGDLEYLKAGGRLSNASYLGACVLKIKPLIEILDGKLVVTQKYRGPMKRVAEKYVNEYIDRCNLDREQLYFIYSLGLEEEIKQRMEEIAKEKGFKKITWVQTGCVISTHCGPGAIGIAGFKM
ncbi:DegV family protein [Clostridium sp.]|uniref:DegV family protein n=1 Tax=Clostridium sp. TaxID=1506 RepID=UPI00284F5769|nr:DegV family protein [Clostridium sp.]MDR3597364.1 DegV family protein [Clostridium sp.]